MASSRHMDAGDDNGALERRLKRYGHTKATLINGDDSELFNNSIKRLCSYLSGSEDDDDELNAEFDSGQRCRMSKKFGNLRHKSSYSNDNNNRSAALEMPIVENFNEEKVYLPRGVTDRRLLPQEIFNIPPPKESPETERRRLPPSLTLPRVPCQEEAQYEEATPPVAAPRFHKLKQGPVLSYGASASMETPIYSSQACQYQYDADFDCTALQRNETGSFYIPSSGQTTMSTISPSRKSELEQQKNRHNYLLASNADHRLSTVGPTSVVMRMRPDMMSSSSGGDSLMRPPRKFKRFHNDETNNNKNSERPWRILTFALFICLIFALAVIAYLLVTILVDDPSSQRYVRIDGSSSSSLTTVKPNSFDGWTLRPPRPLPESFDVGDVVIADLQPGALISSYFNLQRDTYVQFNLSVESGAKLAIFGRKTLPPSYTQYDFLQTVFGTKLHATPTKRDTKTSLNRFTDQHLKSTSFDHYLLEGRWYLAFLNDGFVSSTIRFSTHLIDDENKECKYNCYEKGVCNDGKCHCFNGYTGVFCEETMCPVPCSGNGILHNGRCSCNQFWKGNECDVPSNVCEVPNCNGNGVCNSGGDCTCNEGYGGKFCEKRECPTGTCSDHGVCFEGRCYCHFGWQGDSCDFAYTSNVICPSANIDQCSQRGVFNDNTGSCTCDHGYEGLKCEKAVCDLDCGFNGKCDKHVCICNEGWTGDKCTLRSCSAACNDHGQCHNGSCLCEPGWNGELCLFDGCPNQCNNHGRCSKSTNFLWSCVCNPDFTGSGCEVPLELHCSDRVDNDDDGLTDCEDSECCSNPYCNDSSVCQTVPDPQHVLIRMQAPPPHSSFYDKVKFLLDTGSLQQYPIVSLFNQNRSSVIRGRIVSSNGAPMIGVRIADASNALFGFTLSRTFGIFDLMVNGGGSVTLQFMRVPFVSTVRTFSVGWNEILYVGDIVMSAKEDTRKELSTAESSIDTCIAIEKIHSIRPDIVTSWSFTSLGGELKRSGVVADSQTVQDSVKIPGTDVYLTYSSASASGHQSTLMIYLVPERYPSQLRLVKTIVDVEGVRFERLFEPKSNLSFTFGWDKRNVYKQKVYGLTFANVVVEYSYVGCRRPFVERRKIKLNGYRSSISDLGGWNLHIHHRYDVLNGVLEKGDGSAIYMKEEPPILTTLLGINGKQRQLNCVSTCDDVAAKDASLFSPVALTSSKDGSLFIGDHNLIRKLSIDGRLTVVLELNPADTSHQYFLAVHPLTSDLYVSLPLRRQIWRIRSSALPNVYEIAVGTGENCLLGENCGDGASSEEAKLNYPKGIAFDSQGTLYIADERKIRSVSTNGFVSTLIGAEIVSKTKENSPNFDCKTIVSLENFKLQWPTSIAVNPVNDRLLVLDDDKVFELISPTTIGLVAGAPTHCVTLTNPLNETIRPNALKSSVAIASTLDGKLLVAETDGRRLHRIRSFDVNGRSTLVAGVDSACDCSKNCPCDDSSTSTDFVLASNARLFRPISLTVDNLGVAHVADQGNFKIRSLRHAVPRSNDYFRHYEIYSPISYESYIFNRHGQHLATKNLITDRFVYNFTYHVDAPHGAVVQIYGAGGQRFYILRKDRRMITLENANGDKSIVYVSQFDQLLQKFIGSDQRTSRFTYNNGLGLLISRSDSSQRRYFYEYDEFGRTKSATTPTGDVYKFETNVFRNVLLIDVTKNDRFYRRYSIKPTEIDFENGDSNQRRMIFVQDSGAFHLSSSDGSSTQYDSGTNSLIESYQTSILRRKLTIPASKTLARKELTSKLQWNYQLRRGGGKRSVQVGRMARVNGVSLLQIEYDRETNTDTFLNVNSAKFLSIQYNAAGHISNFHSNGNLLAPMNVSFDSSGRMSGVQWDDLKELYVYDKAGRIKEMKNVGNDQRKSKKFEYSGENRLPNFVELPSGAKYQLHYDDQQNLWKITTPSLLQNYFYRLNDVGSTTYYYFLNSSLAPFVLTKNDDDATLFWRYPSGRRQVTFVYDDEKLVKMVSDGCEINFASKNDAENSKTVQFKTKTNFFFERVILRQSSLSAFIQERRVADNDDIRNDVSFSYNFDDNLRVKQIQTNVDNSALHSTPIDYETSTGRMARFGEYRFEVADGVVRVFNDEIVAETTFSNNFFVLSTKLTLKNRLSCEIRYSYDVRGRLIGENHRLNADEFENSYDYNDDGRLVGVKIRQYQNHQWTYAYDLDGNLKSIDNFSLNYDSFGRILTVGHLKYVADDDGFVVRRGLENFAYDSFGRLVKAWQTNVYENLYVYDERNRLIAFKRTSKWFYFYYGRLDKPSLITHMKSSDAGVSVFFYDAGDRLTSVERAGSRFYVVSLVDLTVRYVFTLDTVVKSMLRAPFGELIQDTDANLFLPVGFKGQFQDPDNGVVIFSSGRPYDPISGRWMSVRIEDLFDVDVYQPEKINMQSFFANTPFAMPKSVKEWSSMAGYDLNAIVPLVSPDFGPTFDCVDGPIVSLGSECVLKNKVEKYHSINSMDSSILSPKSKENWSPKSFTSARSIFGDSVVISKNVSGESIVKFDDLIDKFDANLVSTLLNESILLPVKFFMNDKLNIFYLKSNPSRIVDDLAKLKIVDTSSTLLPGLNLSVVETTSANGRSSAKEIRLNTKFSIVHIRYGGTFDDEMSRILLMALSYAENLFWTDEKSAANVGAPLKLNATDDEVMELKTEGKINRFEAQFVADPLKFSSFLATDPNNLRLIRRT